MFNVGTIKKINQCFGGKIVNFLLLLLFGTKFVSIFWKLILKNARTNYD